MELKPAGSNPKTGKTWKEFWACPNWKDDAHKKAKEEWSKVNPKFNPPTGTFNQSNNAPNAPTTHKYSEDGLLILSDNFVALKDRFNERMDGLSDAFVQIDTQLKKIEKMLKDNIGE